MRWPLVLALSLSACQLPSPGNAAASPAPSADPAPSASPGASVTLGTHTWRAEIEDTPEARAQGLSDRPSLAADAAMVFAWSAPETVKFWMYHMAFPLDVVFARAGKIVAIDANEPPCPASGTCPTFGPDAPVDFVVEVNAGQAAQFGLKPGDPASFVR